MNPWRPLVQTVRKLKAQTGWPTWYFEFFAAGFILLAVWVLSGHRLVELVGTLAVFLSFGHASVADRLSEAEGERERHHGTTTVECWRKERYYFYSKEAAWLIYFTALEAWPALAGVLLFFAYRRWRLAWRART